MTAMTYLTDSAAKLVKELAAFSSIEVEIREDSISIRATPYKAPPKEPGKPTLSANGNIIGRPRVERTAGGRALKLFAYNGERLSVSDWAKRYGVDVRTMRNRLYKSGRPETKVKRGKGDKATIKGKMTEQ